MRRSVIVQACLTAATLGLYYIMHQVWHAVPRDVCKNRIDLEDFFMVTVTVATNLALLPIIYYCAGQERYGYALVGWATFATSSLYHFCESVRFKVWGMDSGTVRMKPRAAGRPALQTLLDLTPPVLLALSPSLCVSS
jgi:hypothetical protein